MLNVKSSPTIDRDCDLPLQRSSDPPILLDIEEDLAGRRDVAEQQALSVNESDVWGLISVHNALDVLLIFNSQL